MRLANCFNLASLLYSRCRIVNGCVLLLLKQLLLFCCLYVVFLVTRILLAFDEILTRLLHECRMKKGFYGLRGRELSLVTIALMCMVIIMLTWEKTPLLNTFPPPQTRLQLTPGNGLLIFPFPFDLFVVP